MRRGCWTVVFFAACSGADPAPTGASPDGEPPVCTGQVVSGCACEPGEEPLRCPVPHPDECLGYRTCEDGAWSDCAPLDHEICNEIDDDCDGEVDEGVLNACGSCDPRCTPPPKDVVQPVVSCFERGRESDALCALPPSECHGQWIVYWTNGRCMNRFCVYDYGVDWCDDWCIGGACMVPFT